jgi:hypothetical protein
MVWQTTVRNVDGRMVAVVTQTQMVLMPAARAEPVAAETPDANHGAGPKRAARVAVARPKPGSGERSPRAATPRRGTPTRSGSA